METSPFGPAPEDMLGSSMIGGSLLGAAAGGLLALMTGQRVLPNMIQGAVTGAVGGAVMNANERAFEGIDFEEPRYLYVGNYLVSQMSGLASPVCPGLWMQCLKQTLFIVCMRPSCHGNHLTRSKWATIIVNRRVVMRPSRYGNCSTGR
jgi:hypothetical protein